MKFPDRFGCLQQSRQFCHRFFPCIGTLVTPQMVPYRTAEMVRDPPHTVLDQAPRLSGALRPERPPKPSNGQPKSGSTNRNPQTKNSVSSPILGLKVIGTLRCALAGEGPACQPFPQFTICIAVYLGFLAIFVWAAANARISAAALRQCSA